MTAQGIAVLLQHDVSDDCQRHGMRLHSRLSSRGTDGGSKHVTDTGSTNLV